MHGALWGKIGVQDLLWACMGSREVVGSLWGDTVSHGVGFIWSL